MPLSSFRSQNSTECKTEKDGMKQDGWVDS